MANYLEVGGLLVSVYVNVPITLSAMVLSPLEHANLQMHKGSAGMEVRVGSAPARTSVLGHTGLSMTESGSEPPLVSSPHYAL